MPQFKRFVAYLYYYENDTKEYLAGFARVEMRGGICRLEILSLIHIYHYIVPEVEDDTVIQLSGNKLVDEYAEAKALGIETKPVVIGAYTMLRLCRFTGKKPALDYVEDIISAYQNLVKKCEENQIAWVPVSYTHLTVISIKAVKFDGHKTYIYRTGNSQFLRQLIHGSTDTPGSGSTG